MRALLVLLLVAASARAQEPAAEEAAAPPKAPALRVLGFVDRPGDCDPIAARFGACIEVVDFLETESLWEPKLRPAPAREKSRAFRLDRRRRVATLRNVTDLHAFQLEDLAFRWKRAGDGVEETVLDDGFEVLPDPASSWETAWPRDRRTLALPPAAAWLDRGDWAATPGNGTDLPQDRLFRRLRTVSPEGVDAPRSATLLAGRFAARLGFDGRLHPYDLMDASPESSGPFFEQMFPFTGAMESDDPFIRPLLNLSAPPQLALLEDVSPEAFVEIEADSFGPVVIENPHYLSFRAAAGREFEVFRRAMGLHLLRFGIEEHTTNQMRVLGALAAMEMPPGVGSGEERARGRELVAAALGETDRLEDVESMLDRSVRLFDEGVRVRFEQLPLDIVDEWMGRLDEAKTLSPDVLREWNAAVFGLYGGVLLPEAPELWSASKNELYLWAAKALTRGRDPQPIVGELRQMALGLAVASLPEEERDRVETWILLDHVRLAIADQFDPTPGAFQTPGQMAETTRLVWSQVLLSHGYITEPIAQGLGAIDPLSVCTTSDGVAALDEPRFGRVTVDVLVDGEDGEDKPGKVLWAARERLPFLGIDDPYTAEPELDRLVGLPGGRALYRVRFEIWAGWHLLWSLQNMRQTHTREVEGKVEVGLVPSPTVRLAARTAAVCTDMVVAPDDLVATLVRAALLDGELRPTDPVRPREARGFQPAQAKEYKDAQSAMDEAQAKQEEAQGKAEEAGAQAKGVVDGGPQAAADLAQGGADGLSAGAAEGIVYTEVTARVEYLRKVVQAPLRGLAGDDGALLVEVFDHRREDRPPLGERPPRTPYRPVARSLSPTDWVASRSWAWWLRSDADEPAALLQPGYQPGNSVGSASPVPRWRRGQVADGWLSVGTSFLPIRHLDYCAAQSADDADVVAPQTSGYDCEVADGAFQVPPTKSLRGEGFGASLQALLAIWGLGEPRVAFEVGAEARLDVGHGGRSWFFENDPGFARPWTFRPAVGLMVGVRGMPLPAGLSRSGDASWPWGAERPDGRSALQRFQFGARGGLLIGPGFNGPEGTAVADLWMGGSLRRLRGPRATFSPYQPSAVLGPFARGQFGFRMDPDLGNAEEYVRLVGRAELVVGVRLQFRLAAPEKPNQPDKPATPELP